MPDGNSTVSLALTIAGSLGLGGIVGKVVEAYYNRSRTSADAGKTAAETDKLRAETDQLIRDAVAHQVEFILNERKVQREEDRATIAMLKVENRLLGERVAALEMEVKKLENALDVTARQHFDQCGTCDKWPLFGKQ